MVTRYVFVGAGAIGSALGGLLAHRGQDVLLVARGEHAAAMRAHGLRLRCPDTTIAVHPPTVTDPDEARLGVDDVLVLTTKTQQAVAAVEQWADVPVHDRSGRVVGHVRDRLPLLTALNGVAGEDIALRYVDRVFAVCVWFPAVMIEPGEVIVRTTAPRGVFHIGRHGAAPDPAADAALLDRTARDWGDAGVRVIPTDAVTSWKYRKLLTNVGNAIQALLGDTDDADDIQEAAVDEAARILAAAGVALPGEQETDEAWGAVSAEPVPDEPAGLGGSSWQSLVRGTGTIETDFLNGEIALMARRLGVPAPVNTGLSALARGAAHAGRPPGSMDAQQLRTHLDL